MKTLIRGILVLLTLIIVILAIVHTKVSVDISSDDLPQDMYQTDGTLSELAMLTLTAIVNPLSVEDNYTLTEEFINYMILDSIRENVNASYHPLDDTCDDASCLYIVETELGYVQYVFAELIEDNQLLVTVSFYREDFPETTTALYATFDIDVSILELQMTLTLDTLHLGDIQISKNQLDTIFGFFDKESIESAVTMGELDLSSYTYSMSLRP